MVGRASVDGAEAQPVHDLHSLYRDAGGIECGNRLGPPAEPAGCAIHCRRPGRLGGHRRECIRISRRFKGHIYQRANRFGLCCESHGREQEWRAVLPARASHDRRNSGNRPLGRRAACAQEHAPPSQLAHVAWRADRHIARLPVADHPGHVVLRVQEVVEGLCQAAAQTRRAYMVGRLSPPGRGVVAVVRGADFVDRRLVFH